MMASCASTGNPTGGPKDETPPELLVENSTKNLQTNFTKQEIELNFDEFINLKNPLQQVVVSPPLIYPLQFKQRGKSIKINFHENETLKDDVTYSVGFGESIEDFREGNKLENFKFVFSTGDVLDSLKFSGRVLDALTREPAEKVLVMLYDTLDRDSIPYLERPYYFATTDEDGYYSIENMKNDTFKVFALGDANLNYIYDQDTELIGFTDSLYIVTDSTSNKADLEVYTANLQPIYYGSNTKQYRVVRMEFDRPPDNVYYTLSDSNLVTYPKTKGDSLLLYYEEPVDSIFSIYLASDTIEVNTNRTYTREARKLEIADINANLSQGILKKDSIFITFDSPIEGIDTTQLKLSVASDTLNQGIDGWSVGISKDSYKVYFRYPWSVDDTLSLTIDSAAIINTFGDVTDSTAFLFRIESNEKRGILQFELDSITEGINYVVELKLKDKKIKTLILNKEKNTAILEGLKPGQYNAVIIEDLNGNGKWDAGNYLQHMQPERIRTMEIEEIRENWEVQSNINWTTLTQK